MRWQGPPSWIPDITVHRMKMLVWSSVQGRLLSECSCQSFYEKRDREFSLWGSASLEEGCREVANRAALGVEGPGQVRLFGLKGPL